MPQRPSPPPRPQRTPAELREASKHLAYEVAMFEQTCFALEGGSLLEVVHCALLESFAVHTRNLLDVFFRPTSHDSDDVLAVDFVTDPAAWARSHAKANIPIPLANAAKRANKEIAHLTYTRIQKRPDQWDWQIAAMLDAMSFVIVDFAAATPDDHLDPHLWRRRKSYVESPYVLRGVGYVSRPSRAATANTTANSITANPTTVTPKPRR